MSERVPIFCEETMHVGSVKNREAMALIVTSGGKSEPLAYFRSTRCAERAARLLRSLYGLPACDICHGTGIRSTPYMGEIKSNSPCPRGCEIKP